jgi:hypothetical protein
VNLLEWSNADVVAEIRGILRAGGNLNPTERQCRAWAALFVKAVVPRWRRGSRLSVEEAVRVGARFEERVRESTDPDLYRWRRLTEARNG